MPLPKLYLAPESSNYSAGPGTAVLIGEVAGGLSRARLDQQGAPFQIKVGWLCSLAEFAYLGAFYRSSIANGSQSFLIDLLAGYAVPLECEAIFLPGSFQLGGISGETHSVTASLEAKAPARDAVADAALVAAYAAPVGGLPVMALTPSLNGYQVARGATTIRSQPGLGPSALRLDRFNTSSRMAVSWNVGPRDHDYLAAFYFTAIAQGALPFLIESVHDHPDPRQLKAHMVPGSFGLRSVNGLTFAVQATVEVVPIASPDYDASVLTAFSELGPDWLESLDDLARLVNVDMPTWD